MVKENILSVFPPQSSRSQALSWFSDWFSGQHWFGGQQWSSVRFLGKWRRGGSRFPVIRVRVVFITYMLVAEGVWYTLGHVSSL